MLPRGMFATCIYLTDNAIIFTYEHQSLYNNRLWRLRGGTDGPTWRPMCRWHHRSAARVARSSTWLSF